MWLADFAGCCGANILYGLEYEHYGRKISNRQFATLKQRIKERCSLRTRGLIFATINTNQIKVGVGKALEECGFKKAGKLASNGANDIQGYVLNVTPSNAILAKKWKQAKGRFGR